MLLIAFGATGLMKMMLPRLFGSTFQATLSPTAIVSMCSLSPSTIMVEVP